SDGLTIIPETILAETDDDFMVNSLVAGSGAYAVSGKDAFYLGQLGPAFGGSGGITRILVNPLDAEDVTFEDFFTPAAEDLNLLNPSALALDISGDSPFGQFLYMGTFGPSLGDDFDGEVYVVDAGGQISPFVTAYRQDGQPAMMDELEVTGFFDVVDMAFPPTLTGPFGAYLYVLSENIDQNGAAAGGYNSDLWRIDPAGVAELFVEDIADGVISLAFGGFDYDNDLFVATFSHSVGDGKVLRVDSEGNVETFFDFGQFSSDLSVCDLAFVPTDLAVDSPLAGALVLTLQSSTSTYVVQLAPDGETYWTWAGGLDTGDVSSGDLAFGRDDALVIAQQGDRSLLQLEYLGLFDYTFEQLQTRVMLEEDPESVGFAPYALVQVADQPRILRLADSGNPADIATEVGPSILDVAEAPADGSKPVSFVFDAAGDLYCYIRNLGEFCTSQRDEAGGFTEFTTLLTRNQIDGFTGLVDAQLAQLAWSSADGGLLAIGSNGTDANAEELPSQEFDDLLVWMGNTLRGQYEPNALVDVGDLTQMRLGLLGPGGYFEYVASGTVLDETIEDLAEGTYRLTIGSILNSSDAYQLVITLDSTLPGQLICRESTGPVELTREDGRRLVLSHQGSGQSRLDYLQEPNGILTQMSALTILGPNISTSVSLVNLDEPNDMVLDEIVLYGSMGRLEYLGTLALLRGAEFTSGTVEQAVLGTVRDVEAARYAFGNFQAVNLGDADTTDHQLRAKGIGDLRVRYDVQNITVLDYDSGNSYDSIDIGGIMADSIIWGRRIKECLIRNGRAQAAALDASYLSCTAGGGSLGLVRIEQGDVVSTGFYADKGIERVELLCGNLDSSTIETLAANSWVGTVLVGRAAGAADDESGGDILNCRIAADRRVIRVHADGNIDEDCIIGADGRIDTVSCRGDCSGTISSVRIGEILAGFDRDGQKVPEEGAFTGGNFGGTVYVTNTLDLLSATGSIEDADIRANLLYQGGWIKSIFAEDGFLDSTVTFNKKVTRIMVGYENGRRDRIVNAGADVSGTISGPRLGRLYYTGGNTATLSVKHLGPVKDDQPGN
ncbi:MAG: hypothetical protein JW810_02640, partial [Sedimentisphaerales bacterium]|nr:hypothetical protein [Sedimentisphaerales bacterium]